MQNQFNKEELKKASLNTQSSIIGLFHPRFYFNNDYIPVVEDNDGTLTCIEMSSSFLCFSTLYIGADKGRFVPFPDSKSLLDMKEDIIFFHK